MTLSTLRSPRPSDADLTRLQTLNSCDMLHEIIKRHHTNKPVPASDNIQALLSDFRAVKDVKERLAAMTSELNKREEQLKFGLIEFHEKNDVDQVRDGSGLTVYFTEKLRVTVDPEKWDQFHAWCVKTDNTHLMTKAVVSTRFTELVEQGVELPDSVVVTAITDVGFRRKG